MDFKKSLLKLIAVFVASLVISIWLPLVGFAGLALVFFRLINNRLRLGLIASLVLSVMLNLVSASVLLSVATVFKTQLNISLVYPVLWAIFGCLSLVDIARHPKAKILDTIGKVTRPDVLSLIIAGFVFALLFLPMSRQSGVNIAQFISYGEDNASHYALSRYIYKSGDLGYLHKSDDIGLLDSLEIYPQGFHASAATTIALAKPLKIPENRFIKLYLAFIAADFALLIFWLVNLAFSLSGDKVTLETWLAIVPAMTLLVGLSQLMLLLSRGFQPQTYSYAFLMAITYVVAVVKGKQKTITEAVLLLLAALSIGIATSWWLLLPLVASLIIYYCFTQKYFRDLWSFVKKQIIPLLIIAFAILLPIIVNLLLSTKNDPLSEPGGVDRLSNYAFAYILIPALVLILVRAVHLKKIKYLLIGFVSATGLAALIGFYHIAKVGHPEYYFYKSLFTVLLFSLVIFFTSSAIALEKIQNKLPAVYTKFLLVAVLMATFVVAKNANVPYINVYIHNWYPNAVTLSDMLPLFNDSAIKYKDIVYVGDCNSGSDYLSNRMSGARMLSEQTTRSEFERSIIYGNFAKANTLLGQYIKQQPGVLVMVDRSCQNKYPVLNSPAYIQGATISYTN